MKRSLLQSLVSWRSKPGRRPLLLRGARQTGKTYLVDAFAESEFEHYLKINFEKETALL